jgi:hypothetical protein
VFEVLFIIKSYRQTAYVHFLLLTSKSMCLWFCSASISFTAFAFIILLLHHHRHPQRSFSAHPTGNHTTRHVNTQFVEITSPSSLCRPKNPLSTKAESERHTAIIDGHVAVLPCTHGYTPRCLLVPPVPRFLLLFRHAALSSQHFALQLLRWSARHNLSSIGPSIQRVSPCLMRSEEDARRL